MTDSAQPTPRSGASKSHGQMTAVMRAAHRRAEPRVLRVALVRGGQVIDERILPRGAHLTVGPSEHNTFVIADLPATVRLVEHGAEGYRLRAARGVTGRVAKGAAIHDLEAIGGDGTIALGEDARGKIRIGACLVLFHFVEPPARPPRAALPLAVRKGAFGDLDWKTTFIAAVSFLAHFGALGVIYSDWADPVTDDDARVAQLVQIVKEIPAPPPPIEQRQPDADASASAKPTDAAPSAPARPAGRTAAPGPASHGVASGDKPMSDTRAHEIQRDLEAMRAAMLLAIGGRNDGATGRVLAHGGELPIGIIDNIGAAPGGARPGEPGGLKLGGDGGGIVRPGAIARGGLPGADVHADARAGESGKAAAVRKPVGRADIPPPTVSGNVPDAGRVVAGMRGALRACYKHALDEDPNMRGSVRVTASIAPNGEVKSVRPAASGLSSSMVACVARVVRGAQFSAPEGGGATLVIPMTFIPQ